MKATRLFLSYPAYFFLERKLFQTKVVEKNQNIISCSITLFYFRKLCRFKIIWKNTVEPERAQMTIWRMPFASCVRNATNTQS